MSNQNFFTITANGKDYRMCVIHDYPFDYHALGIVAVEAMKMFLRLNHRSAVELYQQLTKSVRDDGVSVGGVIQIGPLDNGDITVADYVFDDRSIHDVSLYWTV